VHLRQANTVYPRYTAVHEAGPCPSPHMRIGFGFDGITVLPAGSDPAQPIGAGFNAWRPHRD
jgi:hypothetical protein